MEIDKSAPTKGVFGVKSQTRRFRAGSANNRPSLIGVNERLGPRKGAGISTKQTEKRVVSKQASKSLTCELEVIGLDPLHATNFIQFLQNTHAIQIPEVRAREFPTITI